jgi:hypothetical protein
MLIDFEEKRHIYSVNGEIASISVTELLSKHGLAPDYSGINNKKLRESADKGKEVHKDLENVLNIAAYEPTTEQGKQFAEWVKEHLDCGVGEQMLAYEYNGLIIAGTADVMAIAKDRTLIVADHKNTAKFHREYVSWQVSILDYFARKLGREKVNGKLLNWKGAKKFYCFHYEPKTGEMNVYELEKIADEEIEKLIDCELHNEIYQRAELVIDPELQVQFLKAEEYLAQIEQTYKQAEENARVIREQMLSIFEKQGIKSWESPTGKIKVTYVAPIDSLRVDNAKLKKKYPQVFSECQKISHSKAQIRVKVRGEDDDE